jgi:hypothetical protein
MPWLAAVLALMRSGAMAVAVLARRADTGTIRAHRRVRKPRILASRTSSYATAAGDHAPFQRRLPRFESIANPSGARLR